MSDSEGQDGDGGLNAFHGQRAGPGDHLQQPDHLGPQGQRQDQDGEVRLGKMLKPGHRSTRPHTGFVLGHCVGRHCHMYQADILGIRYSWT